MALGGICFVPSSSIIDSSACKQRGVAVFGVCVCIPPRVHYERESVSLVAWWHIPAKSNNTCIRVDSNNNRCIQCENLHLSVVLTPSPEPLTCYHYVTVVKLRAIIYGTFCKVVLEV